MTVVVRRSALRMWAMAMGGIPLLILSLDVLTNRRITNALREMLFRPEQTQIFEPRDVIWAWAMLVFSIVVVLWGLKELFAPTPVVAARPDGLALKVLGPLRRPVVVPWDRVTDLDTTALEDEGDRVPLFVVEVSDRELLPDNPWGARWVTGLELGILTEDWSEDPAEVAERIVDYVLDLARRGAVVIPGEEEE